MLAVISITLFQYNNIWRERERDRDRETETETETERERERKSGTREEGKEGRVAGRAV